MSNLPVAGGDRPMRATPVIRVDATGNASDLSSSSATARVATSTTAAVLRAASAQRKGLTIYNESSAVLYVRLGAAATATDYTYAMPASYYYEVPYGWTGIVSGVLATGTGFAQVTELT